MAGCSSSYFFPREAGGLTLKLLTIKEVFRSMNLSRFSALALELILSSGFRTSPSLFTGRTALDVGVWESEFVEAGALTLVQEQT